MKKFKDGITQDIGWKLFSFALAVLLWFIVINIKNPQETRSFAAPITLQNIEDITDNGYVITNLDEFSNVSATIRIRAPRLALDNLSQNKNNIKAVADVKKVGVNFEKKEEIDSLSVPVEISFSQTNIDNGNIVGRSNPYLELKIEKNIRKRIKVEPAFSGSLSSGYVVSKCSVKPEYVFINGPQSAVNAVESVLADINVNGLYKDFSATVSLKPVNAEGTETQGVTLTTNEAAASVGISRYKSVKLSAETYGKPMDGYGLKSVSCTPEQIEIIGDGPAIDAVSGIVLPKTDLTNKYSSFTAVYTISNYIPSGASIRQGQPINVSVSVEISPINKESRAFDVSAENISFVGTPPKDTEIFKAEETTRLLVSGSKESLDKMSADNIKGTVDISQVTENTKALSISFSLPSGVVISGETPVMPIRVKRAERQDNDDAANSDGADKPNNSTETPNTSDSEHTNNVENNLEKENENISEE